MSCHLCAAAVPNEAAIAIPVSVQHQQTLQAETTRGGGGAGGSAAGCGHDGSPGPRYSRPESGSQAAEDRTPLSLIWTALGDLLPQTEISIDKVSR